MKSNFPEQEQYAHQISTEQLVDMSEFLRMWFGIEHLQFGDRKPCDLLLIRILNLSLSQSSLRNWGKSSRLSQNSKNTSSKPHTFSPENATEVPLTYLHLKCQLDCRPTRPFLDELILFQDLLGRDPCQNLLNR